MMFLTSRFGGICFLVPWRVIPLGLEGICVSCCFFLGGGDLCFFWNFSLAKVEKNRQYGKLQLFSAVFLLRFKVGRKARIVKLTSEQGQAGRGMEVFTGSKSLIMAIVNRDLPPYRHVPPARLTRVEKSPALLRETNGFSGQPWS